MLTEAEEERRIWDLLTRDFYWELPEDFPVKLYGATPSGGQAKLQVFEVAVASIFAHLRPEYDWYVTPNRPDGGLDFVGRQAFLTDEALGIAAAITVGGQCKKRARVDDIVGEVAGSLARMATTVNPTFFVVALSARLERARVEAAREILEAVHHRHCHILDRAQIEGLLREHLAVVESVLREGLTDEESDDVRAYFATEGGQAPSVAADVTAPSRVLAGVPFTVTITVRSVLVASPGACLSWVPADLTSGRSADVTLIGPIGVDAPHGTALYNDGAEDPMRAEHVIELITYSVGTVPLGELLVAETCAALAASAHRVGLGEVEAVENIAPRFYERPFRAGLAGLSLQYDRALAGAVASIGVVGAGGSGKSRLATEFSLERRRRGAQVVTARHAKTLNDPHRILAELLAGLVGIDDAVVDPSEQVMHAIARYDGSLADRAQPTVRSIFGASQDDLGAVSRQGVVSCLVLLIAVKARSRPLILHLQDLHWATADTLIILARLVWQLEQRRSTPRGRAARADSGAMFIFEGRIHEQQKPTDDGWMSEPFEMFLQTLDAPLVRCAPFAPEDALIFVRRLFEERHSAHRLLDDNLIAVQQELIEEIDRVAGGNPFHTLEQIHLLKAHGAVRQNRSNGLLFLAQPPQGRPSLPESVFAAISQRWHYLRSHTPQLGRLIWAASLLDDRLPESLFRRLWRELAPDISLNEIDATEMLWIAGSEAGELGEVAFRHENYFRSIRRFEASSAERRQIVAIYSGWFEAAPHRDPRDELRWAQILLELPEPDVGRARTLLRSGLDGARTNGDEQLARVIEAAALDLAWDQDARAPMTTLDFMRGADEEILLIRDLLDSDRLHANRRLTALRSKLDARRERERAASVTALAALERRQLTAEVLRSQILFNDRHVAMASDVAGAAVRDIAALRASHDPGDRAEWDRLEMEALHSSAVALALSGEIDEAIEVSGRAVDLAQRVPSALAARFVAIHANILLARDPARSEAMLAELLTDLGRLPGGDDARYLIEINLGMALLLNACRQTGGEAPHSKLLQARALLSDVFGQTYRIGRYANAAAAALLLGIVSAVEDDGRQVWWFAQAVAAASRGYKMETLWRAHVNLAVALRRRDGRVGDSVREHAAAALELLDESLAAYSEADRSARFELVRSPLAQAVSLLLQAGDDAGRSALVRYPALRRSFLDIGGGTLRDDRGGYRSHEWVRVAGDDYVIY